MTFRGWLALSALIVVSTVSLSGCAGVRAAGSGSKAQIRASAPAAVASPAGTFCPATTTASPYAATTGGVATPAPCTGGPQAPQTSAVAVEGGSYTDVKPVGLAAMLQGKDFLLIDVHTPYAGEIAGTDQQIPYDQIEQLANNLPADKAAKIVLYCRSGAMSATAARSLVKMGYTNVWTLEGGMSAWEQAGNAIVTNK